MCCQADSVAYPLISHCTKERAGRLEFVVISLYGIVSGVLYIKTKTSKENKLPARMLSPAVSRLESILNFG